LVTDDIRRLGFRRWYERQLIESHAYLVTAFLALILLLAGYEALEHLRRSPGGYVLTFALAAAAGVVMFISWRRFSVLLARAEAFAESAGCPSCKRWGSFDIVAAEPVAADDPPEAGTPHWVGVRCRGCGTAWKLGASAPARAPRA
jgi:hypothetical protein